MTCIFYSIYHLFSQATSKKIGKITKIVAILRKQRVYLYQILAMTDHKNNKIPIGKGEFLPRVLLGPPKHSVFVE